jgi:hypothetical protein
MTVNAMRYAKNTGVMGGLGNQRTVSTETKPKKNLGQNA